MSLLLALWGLGVAVSLAVTGLVAVAGLGDVPGERSSHSAVTPTAGGLGVVAGMGATLATAAPFIGGQAGTSPVPAVVALLFATALIGLQDDVHGLRTGLKFALVLLVAALTVAVTGPVPELPLGADALPLPAWVGQAGAILWIFVVVNAVNFMDGINGLMAGYMNAALLVVGAIAAAYGFTDVTWLALAASAGLVGFLPYNFRARAAVFCGDTGALPVGYLFAVIPLLAASGTGELPLLYLAPLMLVPFLADVLMTLVRKIRRGERFMAAHRDHLYQRLSRRWGHVAVSGLFVALSVPLAALALASIRLDLSGSLWALLSVAGLAAIAHLLVSRAMDRNRPDPR